MMSSQQNKLSLETSPPPADRSLECLLEDSARIIGSLGDEYEGHREKLLGLRERLTQGRIHLAVLGQFKRGKSSLVNALMGAPILPAAVVPLTSIPTYVKYGVKPRARVFFDSGRPDELFASPHADELSAFLARYVSEEQNPGNKLCVRGVEVFSDTRLLRQGAVLIDTPGIGSTHLHNTESTLNFLPRCDAALFVVSPDPPITEAELVFLSEVKKKAVRIFFVLNKIDYLDAGERGQIARFIRKVLAEKAGIAEDVELFPVSARNGLAAARDGDSGGIEQSGIEFLLSRLRYFMAREKTGVLRTALAGKCATLVFDAETRIRLALKAFRLPMTEIEEKLALFDKKVAEAERQKTRSADILAGEKRRLTDFLEEQSESLRRKSRAHLEAAAADFFNRSDPIENTIRRQLADSVPAFFEHELGELSRVFDERVAEIIRTHEKRAAEIISAVRKAAAEIFDIPYRTYAQEGGMEFTREPYWVRHQWKASLSPLPEEWIDRLVPKRVRERRIRRRIGEQISGLVVSNVESLRWATLQNLNATFRKIMPGLEQRFNEIIGTTRRAVIAAVEKRENYAERTKDEITRLEQQLAQISGLGKALEAYTAG